MKCCRFKFVLLTALALAACEVGPNYVPPPVDAPQAYKESGNWQPAKPADAVDRGAWWETYNDLTLSDLEKQVDVSNQNLKAAEAAYREARAVVDESRAQLFPTVAVNGSGTRSGGGSVRPGPVNTFDLAAGASWEPDVWGRIRREIESNVANAQASAADLAAARLSAQTTLATDYFALRAQDDLQKLLDDTVTADQKSLQIVKNQYTAGVAAQADVLSAQTLLESVQAQQINVGILRAQLEHAIAVLTGKPPSELTIPPGTLAEDVPVPPVSVPSALLERRPDIAASERLMAAANAEIGVAIAAWYPDITLSASYGFAGNMLANLIQAPNTIWSLGPSFAETVFDAGLRSAEIKAAHATYDQTVANYRQTILTAFQQVEDNLVALRILEQQAGVEGQVVSDARKAQELVLNQYKAGTVPYSSVLTAETTTLTNEQTALTVRSNRFAASVALIGALGGGWDVSQLAADHLPGANPPAADATAVVDNTNDQKPAADKSWTDNLFGWVDNVF